jgi:hypothetical protein
MMLKRSSAQRLVWIPLVALLANVLSPTTALAIDFKRIAITTAVCGGGAYGGYKLGEKIAQLQIAKKKLEGPEAERLRKSIMLGMAAALCGGGVLLTNTVYGNLSKRDRQAREKEMQAALADANPNTRTYVLPDSKLPGTLTTEAPEIDGDQECRYQVDVLSKDGEPARAKFCRASAKDKYEVDI